MLSRIPHVGEIIVNTEGRRFRVTGHKSNRAIVEYEALDGSGSSSCIAYFERDRSYNAMMTIEGDHCVETREAHEVRNVLLESRARRR